ncbi:hypothetical protein MWU52_11145 [Jannaschia sp. S6380]|uniref:hypothetical protein n=1 Tax=Jannaschia sp. S6380 TaxID=2926408 RepID=UPI001FF6A2E3|nr:hypothetical protein [Jannaschia sp. S6380]MCK0168109.1 hypothetical protein [Jannaschia sp. S6380]
MTPDQPGAGNTFEDRSGAEAPGRSFLVSAELRKGTDMNKAITDGLTLAPPAFASGLGVWSS